MADRIVDTRFCTDISPTCPVQATVYGYYPVFWANTALLAFYGLLSIGQVVFGARYRVFWFSTVMAIGCMGEAVGYGGRLMMNKNPWSDSGFKTQIVCLVLSPSLVAAGIYLTMRHLTLHFGPEYSRIKPALYTWIFISCDLGSLVLQAAGGAVAAAAGKTNRKLLNMGNSIIIAGIAFQVATMFVCGVLAADFVVKMMRHRRRDGQLSGEGKSQGQPGKARMFCFAVAFAYLTLLIRCIYRLPEMAGGWGNPRMRNEKEFLLLDGLMVLLSCGALTVAHPGYMLPAMRTSSSSEKEKAEDLNLSDTTANE